MTGGDSLRQALQSCNMAPGAAAGYHGLRDPIRGTSAPMWFGLDA